MSEAKYRRKVPTVHQVIEMLLLQGAVLRCYRTKKRITLKNFRDTEREHVVELGLFASAQDKAAHDTPDNWRMSFSAAHAEITNGRPATSAGSSKHRIAKAVRMEKNRVTTDADIVAGTGLTPAMIDLQIRMMKQHTDKPLVVLGEDGRAKYVVGRDGLLFEDARGKVSWGGKPKPGGFRKDPARVRSVDGKVKPRKPKMGVRNGR